MLKLDLKSPGKLGATAENAKDFSFYLSKTEYDEVDLELNGQKIDPKDLIYSKEKVPGQKLPGARTTRAVIDLTPDVEKLNRTLDDLESRDKKQIAKVFSYCIATAANGDNKLAAAMPFKVVRPTLTLTAPDRIEFPFNFKDPSKNVAAVPYEVVNDVKSVEQQVQSDAVFKLEKDDRKSATRDRFAGTYTFKTEVPGRADVVVRAVSARFGGAQISKTIAIEAIADPPEVTLTPKKDPFCRVSETLELNVQFKSCHKVTLALEPADIFELDKKELADPGTVKLTAKKGGVAVITASCIVGKEAQASTQLELESGAPQLKLTGPSTVEVGLDVPLEVELKYVDDVQITLEPGDRLVNDKPNLKLSDVLKLSGKKDGKVKLTASGRIAGAERIKKEIEVDVVGPRVKINAFNLRGPKLEVKVPRKAFDANTKMPLDIDFELVDKVNLRVEPAGAATLARAEAAPPGPIQVELTGGPRQAMVTVVAAGVVDGSEKFSEKVDIEVIGPPLRIADWGYPNPPAGAPPVPAQAAPRAGGGK